MFKWLASLLLLIAVTAQAEDQFNPIETTTSFSVVIPSRVTDRYGAPIRMISGPITIAQLGDLFKTLEPSLPAPDATVEVSVIVPKNAPVAYRMQFLGVIHSTLRARYPNAKFELKESFVDLDATAAELLGQQAELRQLKAETPDEPEARAILDQAEAQLEAGVREDEKTCTTWFGARCPTISKNLQKAWISIKHPYNTVIAAQGVALSKLLMTVGVATAEYGLHPGVFAIATSQGLVNGAFGYNARRWSNWCTSHTFPYCRDTRPVRWYNRHGWAKAMAVNFFISVLYHYVFRMLNHLNGEYLDGIPVDSPNSVDYLAGTLIIAIPEVITDGLRDDGFRALELKGYLNGQSRQYIQWANSFLDTGMHTSFVIGSTHYAWVFGISSVLVKLGITGLSWALPAKNPRMVIISEDLKPQVNGERLTSKNFLAYLLGAKFVQSIRNRITHRFSVPDRTMVDQELGLDEAWILNPSPADLERLQKDANLPDDDLLKILNLKDSDRALILQMKAYREAHLGTNFTPAQLCEAALSGTATP